MVFTVQPIRRPVEPPLAYGAVYRLIAIADPLATAGWLRRFAGPL